MPSRSPSRQASRSTSRASRRSPGSFRSRGAGRTSPPAEKRRRVEPQPGSSRHAVSPPPSRSRDRRDFETSPVGRGEGRDFSMRRRSRSPPMRGSKVHSFSPVSSGKRKISPSSKRERIPREVDRERSGRVSSRKRSRSKSPAVAGSSHASAARMVSPAYAAEVSPPQYQGPPDPYGVGAAGEMEHVTRNVGERFRSSSSGKYEETFERPVFRGPDGSAGYDISELKKVVINISRELPANRGPTERIIINPEDVVLVRRPDINDPFRNSEQMPPPQEPHYNRGDPSSSRRSQQAMDWAPEGNMFNTRNESEGSRPIFAREEIMQANTDRIIIPPVDDHRRVVAIRDVDPPRMSGSHARYEPPSPPPRYSDSRSREAYYVSEHRESATPLPPHRDYSRTHRDYDRPSTSGYERERRDEHYERRSEDLRHELDLRRRDDRYAGHGELVRTYERGRDYRGESSSRDHDRGEISHSRHHHRRGSRSRDRSDERIDRIERMERLERIERMERMERRPMMPQPSPPGSSDRRRGSVMEGYERGRREMRRSPSPLPPPHHGGRHEHHLPPQERFHAEHPPPPERFHPMKPWEVDPEYVPKGRSYFEHDNRDEMMRIPHRGRGMPNMRGGPMRGRGMMRGRPFIRGGPMRGFMGGRATGRRGSYVPRFKRSSPHWEHDLFDNAENGNGKNSTRK